MQKWRDWSHQNANVADLREAPNQGRFASSTASPTLAQSLQMLPRHAYPHPKLEVWEGSEDSPVATRAKRNNSPTKHHLTLENWRKPSQARHNSSPWRRSLSMPRVYSRTGRSRSWSRGTRLTWRCSMHSRPKLSISSRKAIVFATRSNKAETSTTWRTLSMSRTASLPPTAWINRVIEHSRARHTSWIRLVWDPQLSHNLRSTRANRYSTRAASWTHYQLTMTWRDSPHSKIEMRSGTSMKAMLKVSSMPSTMSLNHHNGSLRARRYLSSLRSFTLSKIRRQQSLTQTTSIILMQIKIKTWIKLIMHSWWRREIEKPVAINDRHCRAVPRSLRSGLVSNRYSS